MTITLPGGAWDKHLRKAARWWNLSLRGTGIAIQTVGHAGQAKATALHPQEFQQHAPVADALAYAWPGTARQPGGIALPQQPDARADPVDVAAHEIGHLLWLRHVPPSTRQGTAEQRSPRTPQGNQKAPTPGIVEGDQWRAWEQRNRIQEAYCPGSTISKPDGVVPSRYQEAQRVRIVDWSRERPLAGYGTATLLLIEAGADPNQVRLATRRLRGTVKVLPRGRLQDLIQEQCRKPDPLVACPQGGNPTAALATLQRTYSEDPAWQAATGPVG